MPDEAALQKLAVTLDPAERDAFNSNPPLLTAAIAAIHHLAWPLTELAFAFRVSHLQHFAKFAVARPLFENRGSCGAITFPRYNEAREISPELWPDAFMPRTTVDLYRRGNVSGPRMAHVRVGKDVVTYQKGGIDWVAARSGGVSTFSLPGAGRNWWLLPAGSNYPDELIVINDHGYHYSWEPNVDLSLTNYVALLASAEPAFHKIS